MRTGDGPAERALSGWGRAVWSRSSVEHPASLGAVATTVGASGSVLARGLGRSYGDQAMNAGGTVAVTTGLDDIGPVAPDGTVRVAAGVSIEALLTEIVPQGWFVPVSPGTRYVTVGGAIAADIHGKNHHLDGTFGAHVESIDLVIGDGTTVTCGPERDPDLFWATAGGMGLTGIIVAATIRLAPIETSRLLVDTTRLTAVDPLLEAMVGADAEAPLSVAWIDLMPGRSAGRSILTTARFARLSELDRRAAREPLAYRPSKILRTPPALPSGLLRPSTVKAFNEAWFRMAPSNRREELQSITRYFHPLDGVADWNRVYGPAGFLQWQMAVPDGAEATLHHCIDALAGSPVPCFLAVLKRFGPANPGPLSFPLQGWTLAADMPAGFAGLAGVLDELDRRVSDAGGRIYLAKDGRVDPALIPAMYPRLDEWRAVRDRVDPARRFRSDLDRRLGLTG
ncbi:MAG: FAD-binding oxidoreductase [Actinomycetota bacterium]